MNISEMTRDEKSCLLYLECCAVDAGGLVEAIRMNSDDLAATEKFRAEGLADLHRIPARLLGGVHGKQYTHWVKMSAAGFALAHALRAERSLHLGPFAKSVVEGLTEMGRLTPIAAE